LVKEKFYDATNPELLNNMFYKKKALSPASAGILLELMREVILK
jgi:hypothetical protein